MSRIREIANRFGLKIHVDGARIFNSAAAQGIEARELAVDADSITFCLSKGLAAPVGSLVCGTKEFVAAARRARKVVGGGMRQAGVLAAAGIVALEQMVERLTEDHENAKKLATGLSDIDGLSIRTDLVKTNIIFIEIDRSVLNSRIIAEKLSSEGVRVGQSGPRQLRAVTNYHVTADDIDYALEKFRKVMA